MLCERAWRCNTIIMHACTHQPCHPLPKICANANDRPPHAHHTHMHALADCTVPVSTATPNCDELTAVTGDPSGKSLCDAVCPFAMEYSFLNIHMYIFMIYSVKTGFGACYCIHLSIYVQCNTSTTDRHEPRRTLVLVTVRSPQYRRNNHEDEGAKDEENFARDASS